MTYKPLSIQGKLLQCHAHQKRRRWQRWCVQLRQIRNPSFLTLVRWESCGGGKVEAQNYISIANNLSGAVFGNLNGSEEYKWSTIYKKPRSDTLQILEATISLFISLFWMMLSGLFSSTVRQLGTDGLSCYDSLCTLYRVPEQGAGWGGEGGGGEVR